MGIRLHCLRANVSQDNACYFPMGRVIPASTESIGAARASRDRMPNQERLYARPNGGLVQRGRRLPISPCGEAPAHVNNEQNYVAN
jgi:hypothetical protein